MFVWVRMHRWWPCVTRYSPFEQLLSLRGWDLGVPLIYPVAILSTGTHPALLTWSHVLPSFLTTPLNHLLPLYLPFFHPMLPLAPCHHHALSSHLTNAFLLPPPPPLPPTSMFPVLLVSYDLAFNHCLFVCERELVHVPPCELLQCVCTVWARMCCQEDKAAKVVSSFWQSAESLLDFTALIQAMVGGGGCCSDRTSSPLCCFCSKSTVLSVDVCRFCFSE